VQQCGSPMEAAQQSGRTCSCISSKFREKQFLHFFVSSDGSLARVAGMIIYLGYGVWHSSERCHGDTQVMIMDDVTDKDSVNK